MDSKRIDTGDQPFDRRRGRLMNSDDVDDTEGHLRRGGDDADRRRRRLMSSDDVDDTEGHSLRTYPGATDDELDCRMPLPGEEDERLRRL